MRTVLWFREEGPSECNFGSMRKGAQPSVLITGGAKRLGLALAAEALSLGLDVVIHYRRERHEALCWLRRECAAKSRVLFVKANLRPQDAAALVDRALRLKPGLVGLVNNASVFAPGDLSDQEHLRATLDSNALVPAALAEAFRHRVRRGWIVNVTDARVAPLNRTYQNYRISKLLLQELTRQQAFRYAPDVRVNAIAPGAILPAAGTSRSAFRRLARHIPLGRTGDLGAVRQAFAYLVQAEHVTGQTMYVDGGWHLE